jgi:hypothetical protein
MDIIPGRDNNQAQPERTERAESAKTEAVEKVFERPNPRRVSEPTHHIKPKKSRTKLVTYIAGIVIVLAIILSAVWFFNQSNYRGQH